MERVKSRKKEGKDRKKTERLVVVERERKGERERQEWRYNKEGICEAGTGKRKTGGSEEKHKDKEE